MYIGVPPFRETTTKSTTYEDNRIMLRAYSLALRAYRLGSRAQHFGFRVQGLDFWALA